eukprot:TRINITY_DN7152_c0_g1_i1.p1 TRINITY_DN7152_c0_g1~~TRINITY_DN7152_c0_g1_i1.p1  ORF type:complete len:283 (+),score=70.91 TRINITY_DN7152_c0_g1_i1:70-849(+)
MSSSESDTSSSGSESESDRVQPRDEVDEDQDVSSSSDEESDTLRPNVGGKQPPGTSTLNEDDGEDASESEHENNDAEESESSGSEEENEEEQVELVPVEMPGWQPRTFGKEEQNEGEEELGTGNATDDDGSGQEEDETLLPESGKKRSRELLYLDPDEQDPFLVGKSNREWKRPNIEKVGPSDVLERVRSFLPQMEAANEEMQEQIDLGADFNIEATDEDQRYIEMDLTLGILEAQDNLEQSTPEGDESIEKKTLIEEL